MAGMAGLATIVCLCLVASVVGAAQPVALGGGLLKLNFYLQEEKGSAFYVLPPLENHLGNFGALCVLDQPVTVDPDHASLQVGRGRGLAAFANNGPSDAPEVLYSIVLEDSRPDGFGRGTLSFRGSNELALDQRELSIVGGTEDYRFVQGFAYFVTYFRDPVTKLATTNITAFLHINPVYTSYLSQQK